MGCSAFREEGTHAPFVTAPSFYDRGNGVQGGQGAGASGYRGSGELGDRSFGATRQGGSRIRKKLRNDKKMEKNDFY